MLGICAAISGCSRRVNVSWPILPRNLADRLRSEKLGSVWLVSWVPTRWHPDRDEHAISLHDFISQNLPRMQVISKRPAQVYGFLFFFSFTQLKWSHLVSSIHWGTALNGSSYSLCSIMLAAPTLYPRVQCMYWPGSNPRPLKQVHSTFFKDLTRINPYYLFRN